MLLYPGTFSIQCISIDWWFLFLNNLYSNHCLVSFQVFPTFYREFILQVVTNFGNSLKYGNQYIYQSMPRMLTLWLDYGSESNRKYQTEIVTRKTRRSTIGLNDNLPTKTEPGLIDLLRYILKLFFFLTEITSLWERTVFFFMRIMI